MECTINNFRILRYKSLEDITIPISKFGKNGNESSTAFLVGLNECGKSSILEAIFHFQEGFDKVDFIDNYHKVMTDSDEENTDFRVVANFILTTTHFEDLINESSSIPERLKKLLKITNISKTVWKEKARTGSFYGFDFNNVIPFHEYFTYKNGTNEHIESIELHYGHKPLTPENAKSILSDEHHLLNEDRLSNFITDLLDSELNQVSFPTVQFWKPKPEFLINNPIDLNHFKNNTSTSIPLKNIFHISGFATDDLIKKSIDKAILKPEYKAELEDNLSNSITKFINEKWKENKINIKVDINGSSCGVYIEDKDQQYKYLRMNQRSDGFNQFISLLLSISTKNDSKSLQNNIILLDEPEIHLHPSGVRCMRDEILKIGKSNSVIVSTHSHYMIDAETPDRHFIVTKKAMATEVNQVSEETSMSDDEVLSKAFGLSLFKELLPKNILVVEGQDDKIVLQHCLTILYPNLFFSIKSAGGTSKLYSVASILAEENIKCIFILDDDQDGVREKKAIIQNLKHAYNKNNVLTIKDLCPSITDKSTLEDLFPSEFVKLFFEKETNQKYNLNENQAIILQIKNQNESLKGNKEQLLSKKFRLAEEFIARNKTITELEKNAPNIITLAKNLVSKMN